MVKIRAEGTYEDDGDNSKDHDCLALPGRSCGLLPREPGFEDARVLLFQIEQRVDLARSKISASLDLQWEPWIRLTESKSSAVPWSIL
jgi:hypothetical protein